MVCNLTCWCILITFRTEDFCHSLLIFQMLARYNLANGSNLGLQKDCTFTLQHHLPNLVKALESYRHLFVNLSTWHNVIPAWWSFENTHVALFRTDMGVSCHELCHSGQGKSRLHFDTKTTFPGIVIFTQGQFWPSHIVIACVCLSVCPSVCAITTCLSMW